MRKNDTRPQDDRNDVISNSETESADNAIVPLNTTPSFSAAPRDGEGSPGMTIDPEPPDKIVVDSNSPSGSTTGTGTAPDPFDPSQLRLTQDFGAHLGVKKALITVPVRKPTREAFVQVRPGEDHRLETCVIELKDDREVYLVDRDLWPELVGEATFGPRALFTAMTRQGVLFIWPVRLPGTDGKVDSWNESALEAAKLAESQWIRIASNMHLGAYEVHVATAHFAPPAWPDIPFKDLLRIGFKGRFIDTPNHIVLRKLRGEA